MIFITGGAGFIGSNFVLDWLAQLDEPVMNLDKLTYAGNLENLSSLQGDARHVFVQGDLRDRTLVDALLAEHRPRAVLHFAAESHVDRSYHFPEKLIPLMIVNALAGKPLPVYGDGMQIRDWLYVRDHCSAIRRVLEAGRLGETYNVGGWNEKPNIEIVHTVCQLLDELRPRADGQPYAEQITYVTDRPGHDRRYAIDAHKIERELGWKPAETFETGIRKTVLWYLDNPEWVSNVQSGAYREWMVKQYEGAAA